MITGIELRLFEEVQELRNEVRRLKVSSVSARGIPLEVGLDVGRVKLSAKELKRISRGD